MSKGKQGRNQAARGKGKSSRKQEIPSEIRHCIKGRTVDLSTASKYYRKCWEAVSPRVEEEIKKKGLSHYELKPRFFRFFLDHLNELVSRHYGRSEMNAGDCAARALYRAALLVGRTKTPLTGPSPRQLWPSTRPISQAWQKLGRLPMPGGAMATFEVPDSGGELRLTRPGEFNYPRISMSVTCAQDRAALPKITIQIKGEPVCVLIKAMYELDDPEERCVARKEAKRIWNFLRKRLSVEFGVERIKGGHPLEDRLKRAAYHKYFQDATWRQVAAKLCPDRHTHTKECQERFRRGVGQYWKRMRKQALSLPPVKA